MNFFWIFKLPNQDKELHNLYTKSKVIPVTAVEAHSIVRRRDSHIFYTISSQMAMWLPALRSGRLLAPTVSFLVLISIRGWVDPRATVLLEESDPFKKSKDLIGIQTRYLPACSIMSRSITLPRASYNLYSSPNIIRIINISRIK
jgi:hypothetical protein